jgi:peroxiredoxin
MIDKAHHKLAPELETTAWLNIPAPLKLSELKGKIVVIHAFQMLCPGCVAHGIPQASTIHHLFANKGVQVLGLHTVFEHHEVMSLNALTAFVGEYRLPFPVAVDTPSATGPIPLTMEKYQMQGTPTLIIIDQQGQVRLNHFGRISDMEVGSLIGGLLAEEGNLPISDTKTKIDGDPDKCGTNGCLI